MDVNVLIICVTIVVCSLIGAATLIVALEERQNPRKGNKDEEDKAHAVEKLKVGEDG